MNVNMQRPTFPAAVVMQWTRYADRWRSEKWEAVGVLDDAVSAADAGSAAPRLLHQDENCARWLHPGFKIEMYRDEAEGYYLNLTAAQPYAFVMWRADEGPARPVMVTLSYNEAARMMDGGESVDGVPMPANWRPALEEFVACHYRPDQKKARARPPSFKGARRDES